MEHSDRDRTERAQVPAALPIEELLKRVDPAPDEETDRFVEIIYAERRASEDPRS